MGFRYLQFKDIDLADPFFTSLKEDYAEFGHWFARKSENWAYVFESDETGTLDGFLFLKNEQGAVTDTVPAMVEANRLKVGTFKINAHGTKLGERFIKKIFDHAIEMDATELYVTIFPKHRGLVALLTRYGFELSGTKKTQNGIESVLVRKMIFNSEANSEANYPLVKLGGSNYLLSLLPIFHTRLLPDSILKNEDASIVEDISHTNSINKVYLAAMRGMENLRPGDNLVIYRTSDKKGPAEYRSVATSICVLEESANIRDFATEVDFLNYCKPHSVFSEDELKKFYKTKSYPFIIKFTYNIALRKRITRHDLIETVGLDRDGYFGFMQITNNQLKQIANDGGVNESLIVD